MSDELHDRVLDRINQGRAARAGAGAFRVGTPASTVSRGLSSVPIGTRVFDTQTAQDGVVVDGPVQLRNGVPVVYVRFDSGVTFARVPNTLVLRPAPPAPRA